MNSRGEPRHVARTMKTHTETVTNNEALESVPPQA